MSAALVSPIAGPGAREGLCQRRSAALISNTNVWLYLTSTTTKQTIAEVLPRRVLTSWRIRRRVIVMTLLFCAGEIIYLTGRAEDTDLTATIANGVLILAGSVIGAYVFGDGDRPCRQCGRGLIGKIGESPPRHPGTAPRPADERLPAFLRALLKVAFSSSARRAIVDFPLRVPKKVRVHISLADHPLQIIERCL